MDPETAIVSDYFVYW